jgi:hypothetical protein
VLKVELGGKFVREFLGQIRRQFFAFIEKLLKNKKLLYLYGLFLLSCAKILSVCVSGIACIGLSQSPTSSKVGL